MTRPITFQEFKARSEKKHGTGAYAYPVQPINGVGSKATIQCVKHGEFSQIVGDHLAGHGCPQCATEQVSIRAKGRASKHLQQVASVFPDYDYSRFVETFTNVTAPVTVICPTHGEFQKPPHKLKRGSGCQACGKDASVAARKITETEFLERAIKVHGARYDYSLVDYVNYETPVTIICREHGAFRQQPSAHATREAGCPRCALVANSALTKLSSEEFYRRASELYNGQFTYTGKFAGVTNLITAVCSRHGEFTQLGYVHLRGGGCVVCSAEQRVANTCVMFEEFESRASDIHAGAYTYDRSSYVGLQEPTSILCKKHGVFSQVAATHLRGSRCPKCAGTVSKGQVELTAYIKELGFNVVTDYVYGESKRELDVFIPSLNIAVEFDGIYFHSSKFRDSGYHLRKRKEVEACGITLIQLFSDEWEYSNTAVKNLLMARLGKSEQGVYARMCEVVQVADSDARAFYSEYHVQPWNRSGTNLGLTYQGQLVAVMTFTANKSCRGVRAQPGVYELARFATSGKIAGAASKLFKHLTTKLNAVEVVSYCDIRKFTGSVYSALGFTKTCTTPPSYTYCKSGVYKRMHKSLFRRTKLPGLLGDVFDASASEKVNCERAGYYQVHDCGLDKWVWRRNLG